MTRGKFGQSAEIRATNAVTLAKDAARRAEIRANELSRVVAARDAEIELLRAELSRKREESTVQGTYTERDVARIRVDAKREHVEMVRTGLDYLDARGVGVIPKNDLYGFSLAFGIEIGDLMSDRPDSNRASKRTGARKARLLDEAYRQGFIS